MRVFAIEFEISLSLWKSAQTIVYRFFRNDLAHETKINDIHKCHLHEKRKFQFDVRTVAHTQTNTMFTMQRNCAPKETRSLSISQHIK